MPFGAPHHHLDETPSTNDVLRGLADDGAPHGTVVSTELQTAGKGRQGRGWAGAEGAIALSVLLREGIDDLLPLRAGLAVARLAGPTARIKWPNDVLVDGRKVAGVLVERVGETAIVGIGVNAAVDLTEFPDDVAARAGSLGIAFDAVPSAQSQLLELLETTLVLPAGEVVSALASRDALVGQTVRWNGGEGVAAGIAADGRLLVRTEGGEEVRLDGGEVHLL